jgi:hypothetical protein
MGTVSVWNLFDLPKVKQTAVPATVASLRSLVN